MHAAHTILSPDHTLYPHQSILCLDHNALGATGMHALSEALQVPAYTHTRTYMHCNTSLFVCLLVCLLNYLSLFDIFSIENQA